MGISCGPFAIVQPIKPYSITSVSVSDDVCRLCLVVAKVEFCISVEEGGRDMLIHIWVGLE
jgi:hypothetical protein